MLLGIDVYLGRWTLSLFYYAMRRSIEWIITRLGKAGARIVYRARRWYVHVASAFPLGTITGLCLAGRTEVACTANSLQRSGRSYGVKIYEKKNSSMFWRGLMVFWVFPKQISILNRGKLIKNWQTGMRNSFLEKVPHNSRLIYLSWGES